MIDAPDALTLVEAKSSAAASGSLMDGLKRVRPHQLGLRPRVEAAVVYGGEELQQRAGARLLPWRRVREAAAAERAAGSPASG